MDQLGVDTTLDLGKLHMGVLFWGKHDEIARNLCAGLEYLGCRVSTFLHNETLPEELDIVFVYGPYGSMVPLANQLVELPESQRPTLVFMMSEQLPDPRLPEWFRYWTALVRSRMERLAFRKDASGLWKERPWMRWVTTKGTRFRYYGDLFWFRRTGILSAFVISSYWTADFLRERGFSPHVFPTSHTPDKWDGLEMERDIPVLWLGKMGSRRRERILNNIRSELEERGVPMLMVDGVENPYVFGEERTKLLSRTKIVLNVLREKWDDNSMRYVLAIPRRALVVTEPTLPHTAFVAGEHIVEAPIDKIADTICYYLEHDDERKEIVERAYEEITRHRRLQDLVDLIEKVLRMDNETAQSHEARV